MSTADRLDDRPAYDLSDDQRRIAQPSRAKDFAAQIIETAAPFLRKPAPQWHVLDIGSGYGHTSVELARRCEHVAGIEPSESLCRDALELRAKSGLGNLDFSCRSIYEFSQREAYDLVVLDNVLEHLSDQPRALEIISAALRPGGALYLLAPNRLWPIEVHYGLPFLSYLPLQLANWYLRVTGRGADYTDASYAPTYFSLNRMLRARKEFAFRYTLPARLELAAAGRSLHYRAGAALIRLCPWFWIVSKALLVIATKRGPEGA